jgi:hypothetical protein
MSQERKATSQIFQHLTQIVLDRCRDQSVSVLMDKHLAAIAHEHLSLVMGEIFEGHHDLALTPISADPREQLTQADQLEQASRDLVVLSEATKVLIRLRWEVRDD